MSRECRRKSNAFQRSLGMSLLLHGASFIAKRPCYNLYPSQNLLWYVIEKVMEKCLFRHAIDCFCP